MRDNACYNCKCKKEMAIKAKRRKIKCLLKKKLDV